MIQQITSPVERGLEYADYILCKGLSSSSFPSKEVYCTWHYIASGVEAPVLENIEYPFIAITTKFTLTRSGRTC